MRKILCALASAILIFYFYSCYEEEKKDYSYNSYNNDIFRNTRWISISDEDSISIDFSYNGDTTYYSWARLYKYKIVDDNKQFDTYYMYFYWDADKKNRLNLYNTSSTKENDRVISFDIDNDKLVLKKLFGNNDFVFYKEKHTKDYCPWVVNGNWHTSLSKDSVVLVFENYMMKEYVYEKNTNTILKYTDYDQYALYKHTYTYQNKNRTEYKLWIYNNNKIQRIIKCMYDDNNQFIIYQNGNPVVYTKME